MMGDNHNIEIDVIVIGSGATGLAAALTAAEGGAKVIVFEKQRSLGGTSNFFEGTFAVESEMQRKRFISYSKDDAFKGIMEYSHWRANPRLVRNIVDETGDTIAWLQQQGVEFVEATANMPDIPNTYHWIRGHGAALVKVLSLKAKEKGVDLRLGVPVKQILKEVNRISGVIVEQNGEEVEVAAKTVVIASGGYANNKEWIKKYTGFDLDVNIMPVGNVDKTGDGIRMAWEVGAAAEGLGLLELYAAGPLGAEFPMQNALELAFAQPDLWVDPRGVRYCDESITFYDSSIGNASAKHKEGFTYRILDDSVKESILTRGTDKSVGMAHLPGTRPVDFDKEMAAALERGSTAVFMGNSVEELATNMGVDPAVLRATIDEYNGYCEKGYDPLFAKARKYLRPLKGPKFYAIKALTIYLGTLGGIKINHNMEVLDKKDKVIPGLYAGGFDAGSGMYGDSYCINASTGLSSSFALNSGRIAARNAVRYLAKESE